MVGFVDELKKYGIGTACEALSVPRSWYYRQKGTTKPEEKPSAKVRAKPKHALSEEEKETVRQLLNSERFCDQSPREVYATLLDEGVYYCHWRTMYRILAEHDEVKERRQQRRHPQYQKPQLVATAPNQVWSWDITWLRGPKRLTFYYLYVILDIFSRFVVGWMIAEKESGELAKQLIETTYRRQEIDPIELTLHADRGTPMKSKPVTQLLADLQVNKTHSRPHTSNDNPFSESQFKTMKYQPDYPPQFESLFQARQWAETFFAWYNYQHHHTNLELLTPAVVHFGHTQAVQAQRQLTLDMAFMAHPKRFMAGSPIVSPLPNAVWINPPDKKDENTI